MSKKLLTAHQIFCDKKIYWVKTYKTLLKYMDKYKHILKPTVVGEKSGKRYFVSESNLNEFVRKFEENNLF